MLKTLPDWLKTLFSKSPIKMNGAEKIPDPMNPEGALTPSS